MRTKKFWWTIALLLLFRSLTLIWGYGGGRFIPRREGFLGGGTDRYQTAPLLWGWANFDGVHYLNIAENGYFQFEQAFFPVYPLLLRLTTLLTPLSFLASGLVISHLFLTLTLLVMVDLVRDNQDWRWAIIFLLTFPTAFFLVTVYTESLFIFLVLLAFWFAKKERWLLAGLVAGVAGGTRLVGIFLLPVLVWERWLAEERPALKPRQDVPQYLMMVILSMTGLAGYLIYLYQTTGDPLYFFHVQPQFGAQRSGSELIFLPQVLWRYLKILIRVSPQEFAYWIAALELVITGVSLGLVYLVRNRLAPAWLLFSLGVILTPTLTGTLSSMPRYVLPAVALVISAGLPKKIRLPWLVLFLPLQAWLTALFLRGYFVG